MFKIVTKSLILLIVMIIITGFLYPLLITGISKLFFNYKSSGSLIYIDGKLAGSELIGQNFKEEKYFHPRYSAAGVKGYDSLNSQGSNFAAANKDYLLSVQERAGLFRKENQLDSDILIPADAVTASGSGLDPEISIENALLQAERIARARNISAETLRSLIIKNSGRQYGFLGESVVNVFLLNLILDRMS